VRTFDPLTDKSRGYYQLTTVFLDSPYSILYKQGMQTMFEKTAAKKAIAENLQVLMDAYALSQSELARRAGVKQVFISRLLDEVMVPNSVDLGNVAEVLGTTGDALMKKNTAKNLLKNLQHSA
jgi:predicted XRE-type DNA-binding protein